MSARTDWDYADMVNPHVRAEEEAHSRGYREGVGAGIFYALCGLIAMGMLLVALDAHAAEVIPPWTRVQSVKPIKASERGSRITICSTVSAKTLWTCFLVR